MNQSIMNKTLIASAITTAIMSFDAAAVVPDQLPITNMKFGTTVYSAGGYFNVSGTIGPFDPNTDLVNDPNPPLGAGGRMPAPGFDPLTASGNIFSYDHFFNNPWEGAQQTTYLTNQDSWANCTGQTPGVGGCADGAIKSSGPVSSQGDYDYDSVLAAMDDSQIAVGIFFQWSINSEIAVLEIFDCDAAGNCTGNGVPMANGPFKGSIPQFNAGLTCEAGSVLTDVDTPVSIDIVKDVLGTDDPANVKCTNPTATTPDNPEGLRVDSVVSPSAEGGTVVINGTVIDYTPKGGFEGPDSFNIVITDDTGSTTTSSFSVQVGGELQNNFTMLSDSGTLMGGTNDVDITWNEVDYNDPTPIPGTVDADGYGIPAAETPVMTIESPTKFNGFLWYAKNVRVYKGPAKLRFDISCTLADYQSGIADCNNPLPPKNTGERYIKMDLADGEIGGHMIFDWGSDDATTACNKANCDIDVVNVWKVNEKWTDPDPTDKLPNPLHTGPAGVPPAEDANWRLVSTDKDGDGVNGQPMIDGAFIGSNANFNYKPDKAGKSEDYTDTISEVKAPAFSFGVWSILVGLVSLLGLRRISKK